MTHQVPNEAEIGSCVTQYAASICERIDRAIFLLHELSQCSKIDCQAFLRPLR